MATRTVERKVQETVQVCDLCKQEQHPSGNMDPCYICRKECCFNCRKLFIADTRDRRILDLTFHVCLGCHAAEADGKSFVESLHAIMAQADTKVQAKLAAWKAWAKERGVSNAR